MTEKKDNNKNFILWKKKLAKSKLSLQICCFRISNDGSYLYSLTPYSKANLAVRNLWLLEALYSYRKICLFVLSFTKQQHSKDHTMLKINLNVYITLRLTIIWNTLWYEFVQLFPFHPFDCCNNYPVAYRDWYRK